MPYISKPENNITWNHEFPSRNRKFFWILSIGIKEPTSERQVQEAISSQKLTVKYNRVHIMNAHRDKYIIITNIQENRCIFNQTRHIQETGNKIIILPTEPTTSDHIGDVVKSPLRSEYYD